ncbi:uncharacterized protein LOC143860601 [Tasmannia lanceolata]|uniref:uncharacterized protein LOC143860601 n=1 Tax=Tasmannia lanceolata TaxID=3420 RepID=UPI0040631983
MATYLLKLSFLFLSIFIPYTSSRFTFPASSSPESFKNGRNIRTFPASCKSIECPKYDVVHEGNGFEIRQYNSTMWISTAPIEDISLVDATRTGFLQLFQYIQGKNEYNETIEMTAPVIAEVSPSDGPFCDSSFVVSFYVPEKNQANPPSAQNLHVQKWGLKYIAVRQFSGFVKDSNVGEEAAALYDSLTDSSWSGSIIKRGDANTTYIVAQYNSPFEFENRVNEIWMMVDTEGVNAV